MTHSITLNIPDQIFGPLSEAARQAGTTPESLAVAWLDAASRQAKSDPFEKWIGALHSGSPGWSKDHDRHIGEAALRSPADRDS